MILSLSLALTTMATHAYSRKSVFITRTKPNENNSTIAFRMHRELFRYPDIDKRFITPVKTVRVDQFRYFVDVDVGNPPQHIEAELSLKYRGSYIVSRFRTNLFLPIRLSYNVKEDGFFAPAKSNTYHRYSDFSNSHSGFFGASAIAYAEDNCFISFTVFERYRFVILTHSFERSMIGLGLPGDKSYYVTDSMESEEETSIFHQMRLRGWTTSASFSIWIGSESSDAYGLLMLNGVDKDFISSDIYLFPLVRVKGKKGYFIQLDAVKHIVPNSTDIVVSTRSIPVELDFNMAYTSLPEDIVNHFYDSYNVHIGYSPIVYCDAEVEKGSIGLVFSGVQFEFPFLSILPGCLSGAIKSNPAIYPNLKPVIGANFLSLLYLVFDQENREVGLALAHTCISASIQTRSIIHLTESIPGTSAPYYSTEAEYTTSCATFQPNDAARTGVIVTVSASLTPVTVSASLTPVF